MADVSTKGCPTVFATMLADAIRSEYPKWDEEAGMVATREQNSDAGDYHLTRLIQAEIESHWQLYGHLGAARSWPHRELRADAELDRKE